MKKSESAVSETQNSTPDNKWDKHQQLTLEAQRLNNERCKIENRLIYDRHAKDALKDKMESARRNIEILSKLICGIYGLGAANSDINIKAKEIVFKNIEVLSEINKFKC